MSAPQFAGPDEAARAFGATAHRLAVTDGRRFSGTVVDRDVGRGLGPAHAFDADDNPIGIFKNRREAVAAISARERFEAARVAA